MGTRLRGYELLSVLGQGSFGITYRAHDTVLDRDVAIKEYLPVSLAVRENRATVMAAFEKVDVIATPTSPTLAFRLGARTEDPLKMYLADMCTVFVNLFGGCGISLPCGFGADELGTRLPVGLHLVAPPFHDQLLLRIAAQYEKLTGWAYEPPEWIEAKL